MSCHYCKATLAKGNNCTTRAPSHRAGARSSSERATPVSLTWRRYCVKRADYIFIDLPYMGMSKGVYSKKRSDLGNMNQNEYRNAVKQIAKSCATAQSSGKLCTVISPNYTDHDASKVIHIVDYIRECWKGAGYALYQEAYSSRRIQRTQNPTMAKLNNLAKEKRIPLTDITVILTFERTQKPIS